MSVTLPDSSSSEITLVQPTNEEVLQQTTLNSQIWKGALSLEAYLLREGYLGQQTLIRDGGLTPWALVWQNGDSERIVLSSCETIRKKALVAQNGEVKETICHGVCSVFCPPDLRGKGYAGRMIQELEKALRTWQTDHNQECLFSVLYSDIGKQFYAARGWQPFPSAQVLLPPSAGPNGSSLPEARPLYAADLAKLCSVDEDLTRKELSTVPKSDKITVAITPDLSTLQWHLAREDFVSKELYNESPEIRGAIVGTKEGERVWCTWTRMWYNPDPQASKGNTLHIMRLVVEDPHHSDSVPASEEGAEAAKKSYVSAATASLLAMAQAEAEKWHMAEVDVWNPTSETLAAARLLDPSAQVTHRESESITSLRWYGEGSEKDVEWIKNEKYAWC